MRLNNSFGLTGNMGDAIEVRFNPNNGNKIATLSLAVDASYKDRDTGEKVEQTEWFTLTVYRPALVDIFEKYTKKGSRIQVGGHLHKQMWDSKTRMDENNQPLKDTRIELVVDEMLLLDRAPQSEAADDLPDYDQ